MRHKIDLVVLTRRWDVSPEDTCNLECQVFLCAILWST